MPIRIPDTLPARQKLIEENIFTMPHFRAVTQDIRPLEIAILNLMPTKETTETQLLRKLSNTSLQINITLLHTATYESRHTSESHLSAFYRTLDEVKDKKPFDGLIVTGAPVETMPFTEVQYWKELTEIMDWADANVFSTFYICWAAQAALYHFYGINKHQLDQKVFGVFEHSVIDPKHKLVRGFDDRFHAPHSRHTTVSAEDIMQNPDLDLLSVSDEAGVYLCADKNGRRIFAMGHSEYDANTLQLEYERDCAKNMEIAVPKHYFPNDDPKCDPIVNWRSHGNLLFGNWLNFFVYQETPYDLGTLADMKPERRNDK